MRVIRTLLFVFTVLVLISPSNAAAAPPTAGKIRWGYYVSHDPNSKTSLQQNIGSLDYVSPFWYSIDEEGNIGGSDEPSVTDLLRSKGVKNLPTIKNSAQNANFHRVLADPTTRERAISNILNLVVGKNYDGINIDFEWVDPADRDNLTIFMAQLAPALRSKGKLVTMAVVAKDKERTTGFAGPYDYAGLAPHNDLILIMTYGYRSASSSTPGPTAPMKWVEGSVAFAVSQIPAEKVILGVAWYGYDWNTTSGPPAKALRYNQVMDIIRETKAAVQYSNEEETPFFRYTKDGQNHEVWFEDQRSVDARLELVNKYNLAGAGGWRMGHEDSRVWQSFNARLGFRTWLLAEGSTGRPYHTWILIQNPNSMAVDAKVTFMKEDGSTVQKQYRLNPQSRLSIFANEIVPDSAFSTKVESSAPIFVERAMYFGHDGHTSPGVNGGSRNWYLPEGFSGKGTDTWILLMNPGNETTRATLTFMKEDGTKIQRTYTLRPTSRLSVFANQIIPGTTFATSIDADHPIVVERASYFDGGKGGHSSVGSPYSGKKWYLAEGYDGIDTWLLLMNPGNANATTNVSFLLDSGRVITKTFVIKPTSRFSIHANDFVPEGSFSTRIDSDQPLVAERSMYWAGGTSGHSSIGTTGPAHTWYLAEGSTADPFVEWVLLMNPGNDTANVTITFMLEGGGTINKNISVGATSRYTMLANDEIPGKAVSIRVDSSRPIIVERSMYSKSGGGTNNIGISH